MQRGARDAYETGARASGSSRDLEAQALLTAARLLDECRRDWEAARADGRLRQALEHNQRLWTFFQAELTETNHPMPADVRTNLLSLSLFVDRRTFEMTQRPTPEGLDALIRVDRELALGLKSPASGNGG